MPIHLPPVSRRRFLASSVALGAGVLSLGDLAAAEQVDPDRWALLADTHISGDRRAINRGARMFDNLKRVADELATLEVRPSGVIINGDCALNHGEPADYAVLAELIQPLTQARMGVHMGLGNHDHRENFRSGLAARLPQARPLESRQISILETPRANWFVLDSLHQVNKTPGQLGDEQRAWLAAALDARPDKPALIMAHHNPRFGNPAKNTGLLDTDELFSLLAPRKQVKAYIFGHTHHWELRQHEGIHLINLPPVAYLFQPTDPNGWVDVRLRDGGATLVLHGLEPRHPASGKPVELTWRGA